MSATGLFYLLLATLGSALMAIALKAFPSEEYNRYGILVGNYITCVLLGLVLMPDRSVLASPEPATLLCGICGGLLFISVLILMQSSILRNGAILTSAFGKLGMLVPLLASILILGETPSPIQWAGILLVIAAILLINHRAENRAHSSGSRSILLLIAVLLGSGGADGIAKIFEQTGRREQDTLYMFLVFLTAGVLAVGLMLREGMTAGKKVSCRSMLAGIAVGIPNYFSSFLLLQALVKLPAFIVYPAYSTGAILIVTLASAFFFKEKPGKLQLTGLGCILIALVLLNLR